MASLLLGGGVVDARGSIAGNCFSRARSGATLKARIKGTNPISARQSIARVNLNQLVKAWQFQLSDADRLAWAAWASSNPVLNRFGQTVTQAGFNSFCQLNGTLLAVTVPIALTPPASTTLNTMTGLTITCDQGAVPIYQVDLQSTGLTADEGFMLWLSPFVSPGKSFISHQLRLISNLISPAGAYDFEGDYISIFGTLNLPVGQKIFMRASVVNFTNGLRSAPLQSNGIMI